MITVKPVQETETVNELFASCGVPLPEGGMAVEATDGAKRVGCGLFSLVECDLTLLYVDFPADDPLLCDLIARGVMNYGIHRGALICELGEQAPKAALVSLGFLSSAEETSMNIVRVFTECTHCHHEK